jgi:cyclic pyranopterin phosphate synthase
MPVDQVFMDEKEYMTPDEITDILTEMKAMGLEEVRLTGGEPLMRKSFSEIVKRIGEIDFKKLGLTTNGIFIDKYLPVLKEARVFRLNISLDSLSPDTFRKITFGNHFHKVIENIRLAVSQGFIVKINTVIMKGINDHEIMDFVRFSENESVEVRFLELMRIGHAREEQNSQYMSAAEMIKVMGPMKAISMPHDSTSFNYVTEAGGQIGFIASESQPFCGQCSRWRLSADGVLRACLLKDDGRSLRNTEDRVIIYQEILGMKPFLRPVEVSHSMNLIGG